MTVHTSSATERRDTGRPSRQARRFGFAVAALVNAAMLVLLNVVPGWEVVPFLTADTALVLGAVNASIVAGLVANLVYIVADPPWLRALGNMVTAAFAFAAGLRLWSVFPFEFAETGTDWALVAHILLGLGIVGTAIGMVAGLVSFVAAISHRDVHGT